MRSSRKRIFLVLLILLIPVFIIGKRYYDFLTETVQISPIEALLSQNGVNKSEGTVNILILGIPGGKHDGPNLSDTIIVANYDFEKNRLITISIPRDIWSHSLRDRINSAYAYGEDRVKGGGLELAKSELSLIYGRQIQYAAVVNFDAFDELVDAMGGLNVEIEQSFTDDAFPIAGRESDFCAGDPTYSCRYETISFQKGKQHMDGSRALKFVRSRHASGSEGTDFARSRRQQQIMIAMKDKLFEAVKTLNIELLKNLYDKLDKLIVRDISNQEVATIAKSILLKSDFQHISFYLPESSFTVPDYRLYDGKYVLIPKSDGGDFQEIHAFVSCILKQANQNSCDAILEYE